MFYMALWKSDRPKDPHFTPHRYHSSFPGCTLASWSTAWFEHDIYMHKSIGSNCGIRQAPEPDYSILRFCLYRQVRLFHVLFRKAVRAGLQCLSNTVYWARNFNKYLKAQDITTTCGFSTWMSLEITVLDAIQGHTRTSWITEIREKLKYSLSASSKSHNAALVDCHQLRLKYECCTTYPSDHADHEINSPCWGQYEYKALVFREF